MWIIIGVLLAILSLIIAFLIIIYRLTFHSPKKFQSDIFRLPREASQSVIKDKLIAFITNLNALPFEQVSITSFDGLTLYAKYYHNMDGAPLDICFHGYRGSDIRDLSGCFTTINDKKRNVLLVSQRANGKSKGHTITFGVKERYDCLSWVNYAIDRFGKDTRILLRGVSMGASTVLYACGLNLPKNVYGVLADCPYDSPKEIIKKVLKVERKLPANVVYPFVWLSARIFAGVNLNKLSAKKEVQKTDIPIIIFHGQEDKYVPSEMSESLASVRENIERHVFKDAGHGLSYMFDTEKYEALLCDFVEKYCPKE